MYLIGCKQASSDACICTTACDVKRDFSSFDEICELCIIAVYDLLIDRKSIELLAHVKSGFGMRYKTKNLGQVRHELESAYVSDEKALT